MFQKVYVYYIYVYKNSMVREHHHHHRNMYYIGLKQHHLIKHLKNFCSNE